jgi:hypothetical protein
MHTDVEHEDDLRGAVRELQKESRETRRALFGFWNDGERVPGLIEKQDEYNRRVAEILDTFGKTITQIVDRDETIRKKFTRYSMLGSWALSIALGLYTLHASAAQIVGAAKFIVSLWK